MENNTIKLSNLNINKFKTYILKSGAIIIDPTNIYEKIRFKCKDGVGVVYSSKNGYTITGCAATAYDFFKRKKDWKANHKYKHYEKPEVLEELYERDGEICFYCGDILGEDVTIEHILSIFHGGPSDLSNLCLTHKACNIKAGNLPLIEKIKLFFLRKPN